MLQPFRNEFNERQFSAAGYAELLRRLDEKTRTKIEFRVCETPVFVPRELMAEMAAIGLELTHQLVDNPEYMRASEASIPERYRIPNENPRPHFMTVDFGLVRTAEGELRPKLVELQAFPSIYGYQDVLSRSYCEVFGLDAELQWYLGGQDEVSYWEKLRHVIVGDHAVENVVLLETDPLGQKTLPDFRVYEDRLGIATVDIATVRKEGRRLLYEGPKGWVPIERIYNRTIVDELERKGVVPGFDYRDELDVEWAGHPNWYFRISKFSIPYLRHECVPPTVFLDEWMDGVGRDRLPEDREQILLKPLYSFAGRGIHFGPSDHYLSAIAPKERGFYLLQQREQFVPLVSTPYGGTQAEFRMMYLWPDDGAEMEPVISLVRLGRGLMMGVDHNKNQEWVGGSAALFPRG